MKAHLKETERRNTMSKVHQEWKAWSTTTKVMKVIPTAMPILIQGKLQVLLKATLKQDLSK